MLVSVICCHLIIYLYLNLYSIFTFTEDRRNDDDYIRNRLKTRLREELEYLEEKRKSDLDAKLFFGDELADKICDMNESRKEALISGKMACDIYQFNSNNLKHAIPYSSNFQPQCMVFRFRI